MKNNILYLTGGIALILAALAVKKWYFTLLPTDQTGVYVTKGDLAMSKVLNTPPTTYKSLLNPSYNGTGSYYKPGEYDPLGFYGGN